MVGSPPTTNPYSFPEECWECCLLSVSVWQIFAIFGYILGICLHFASILVVMSRKATPTTPQKKHSGEEILCSDGMCSDLH